MSRYKIKYIRMSYCNTLYDIVLSFYAAPPRSPKLKVNVTYIFMFISQLSIIRKHSYSNLSSLVSHLFDKVLNTLANRTELRSIHTLATSADYVTSFMTS